MTAIHQRNTWSVLPQPSSTLWQEGCLPAIDLFAGCGGTSLGLRAAGLDLRAAVEINRDAAASYQLNLGIVPISEDIGHVTRAQLLKEAGLRSGECFLL